MIFEIMVLSVLTGTVGGIGTYFWNKKKEMDGIQEIKYLYQISSINNESLYDNESIQDATEIDYLL